jgi:O-succinylbenzoate synthase
VTLETIELWMVELSFSNSVRTALGEHRTRPLVLVRLAGQREGSPVEGWGECAALADTTYDREDAPGAFAVLETSLVPALVERVIERGGSIPGPSELYELRQVGGGMLAFAALEMAVADAHLRAEARSLADVLGVGDRAVPVGAVVGQFETVGALVAEVTRLAGQGFSRIKVKIGPEWDLEPLQAIRAALPDLLLQADANGSYDRSDIEHLRELDCFDLLCLEQPFDRGDLEGHRLLAEMVHTPVCLDESIDSVEAARNALAIGACSVVCVKPARLGGIGQALALIQGCADAGVPLWMGGMFESGFARGVNTTLAALGGFAWPGDLSPAHWYLEEDPAPVPDPTRSGPGEVLCARPPQGPGLGRPPPDPAVLERHLVRRLRWPVAGRRPAGA